MESHTINVNSRYHYHEADPSGVAYNGERNIKTQLKTK